MNNDLSSGGAAASLRLPSLRARRLLFASLVLGTSAALLALMAAALFLPAGVDGWGIAMLLMFSLTLPWTTIGFWNALTGFLLMSFARDPEGLVAPHLRSIQGNEPISTSTAIGICIRNEDPARLSRNLRWMLERLAESGESRWFHLYMLSDSNQPSSSAVPSGSGANTCVDAPRGLRGKGVA